MGFNVSGTSSKDSYKDLFCPICCKILENPIQSLKCLHIFCRECLNFNSMNSKACPLDSMELNVDNITEIIPEKIAKVLSSIRVTCRNNGCKENLMLTEIRDHEANECWYRMSRCKRGCNMLITEIEQRIHNFVCSHNFYFEKKNNNLSLESHNEDAEDVKDPLKTDNNNENKSKKKNETKLDNKSMKIQWNIASSSKSKRKKKSKPNSMFCCSIS